MIFGKNECKSLREIACSESDKPRVCDRCGKSNTEYKTFKTNIDLKPVKIRSTIKPKNRANMLVFRYLEALLKDDIQYEVKVCQSCLSKMLRSCDSNI